MAESELNVWLGDERMATLQRTRSGELRLRYTEQAIERHGLGAVALSIALPTAARHRGEGVTFWAEALLPEGETRTTLETRFAVRRGDTFGLLCAIGADCAGAVSFLPLDARPEQGVAAAEVLTPSEIDTAIDDLPAAPLGADEDVRVSLGGLQAKLLLVRLPDGRWARPAHRAPSTHIAKPDPLAHPGLVVAEAYSLALAQEAGIAACNFELKDWAGRPVLVVERFDREVTGDQVRRIHQEDCCAALGIDPGSRHKYQSQNPTSPSLTKIARLLRQHGANPPADLAELGDAMTVRIAVGDTDGHARNFGLLHQGNVVGLAPLYDVAPTSQFVSTKSVGLWIGGQQYLSAMTADDLTTELTSWGMPPGLAARLPRQALERLHAALPAARSRVPAVPDATTDRVRRRIERLLTR